MKFEKLKPGMTVYDVGRTRMGNTTLTTISVWGVSIVRVDEQRREVVARWNGNPERTYTERSYKQWRETRPLLIQEGMGRKRLATREEIRAAKVQERAALV